MKNYNSVFYMFKSIPLRRPINKIKYLFKCIKWAKQRITRGYADSDVWNIDEWFLRCVPGMLEQLANTTNSYPGKFLSYVDHIITIEEDDDAAEKWSAELKEMAHLLREADEWQCKKEISSEAEFDKMYEEFIDKYGVLGDKLCKEDDIHTIEGEEYKTLYTPSDVKPEWKEITNKFLNEVKDRDNYRMECLNKGLTMFKEHFWDLWD